LGLLEEIERIGLPCTSIDLYDENLKPIGEFDISCYKTKYVRLLPRIKWGAELVRGFLI